jgi:hypothetical protein
MNHSIALLAPPDKSTASYSSFGKVPKTGEKVMDACKSQFQNVTGQSASEIVRSNEERASVWRVLVARKSLSLTELSALSDVDDSPLKKIVQEFKAEHLVDILPDFGIFKEEAVVLRPKAVLAPN